MEEAKEGQGGLSSLESRGPFSSPPASIQFLCGTGPPPIFYECIECEHLLHLEDDHGVDSEGDLVLS